MSIIPWYWKAGAAVLAIAAVLGATDAYLTHRDAVADKRGYDRSEGEWRQREAGIAQAVQKHIADETAQARADTAALQTKFDALADQRQKEKDQHDEDKQRAVARALAGAERLRIPTSAPACSAVREVGNGQGATAAGGTAAAPTADLLPETAAVILDVAGDYGQLVRDYNTVVDRYADIERACNAGSKTVTTPQGE